MSHENVKLKFGVPSDAIVMACPPDVNPDDDSVRYYGGMLVCESASTEWRRRIVACVNACSGIKTEHLERAGLLGIHDNVVKQRDELLAALETLVGFADKNNVLPDTLYVRDAIKNASYAIASAEGGAA